MEYTITIKNSGTTSSFKSSQKQMMMNYIASLVSDEIAFIFAVVQSY